MILPMFAMVTLTFIVGITMRLRRDQVVREGFNWRYYKTYEGEKPPRHSLQADQHFVNLFEVPILFYVACLSILSISDSVDNITFALAWIYVLGRFVHARISLTNNRLLWRARVYVFSGLILYSMWIWIVYIVIKSTIET